MKTRAEYLDELELSEHATPQEIRQAYRDLARVWHPDRFEQDPRMRKKANDKMRRIVEAYDYLKAHPAPTAARAPRATQQTTRTKRPGSSPSQSQSDHDRRRDAVAEALDRLIQRAAELDAKATEIQRTGVTPWENRAWWTLVGGMAVPVALIFVFKSAIKVIGAPLFTVFVCSCIAVFPLAILRLVKMSQETEQERTALSRAEVVCGRCQRGVAGVASWKQATEVLARAQWARAHLRCPHCQHPFQ